MMDKNDEQAAALLDCFCYRHIEPFREHHGTCPAYYRSAVAAALREAQAEQIRALTTALNRAMVQVGQLRIALRAAQGELRPKPAVACQPGCVCVHCTVQRVLSATA